MQKMAAPGTGPTGPRYVITISSGNFYENTRYSAWPVGRVGKIATVCRLDTVAYSARTCTGQKLFRFSETRYSTGLHFPIPPFLAKKEVYIRLHAKATDESKMLETLGK